MKRLTSTWTISILRGHIEYLQACIISSTLYVTNFKIDAVGTTFVVSLKNSNEEVHPIVRGKTVYFCEKSSRSN